MSSFTGSDSYTSFPSSEAAHYGYALTPSSSVYSSPESHNFQKNCGLESSQDGDTRFVWRSAGNVSGSFGSLSPVQSVNSRNSCTSQYYTPSCSSISAAEKQNLFTPKIRVVKRRVSANKKERRRTISINTAFTDLRDCIPNVPLDTKLSKIKTLKLATSYISWLMDTLQNADTHAIPEDGFQSILTKTLESREDRRKRDVVKAAVSEQKKMCKRNRTGWPQHVWAQELNHNGKK